MDIEEKTFWSLTWAVLAILASTLMIYIWKSFRVLKYFEEKKVKYRRPLPIFGNMLPVLRKKTSFAEFMLELHKEFPETKYSGAFEFSSPVYILRDLELIKSITVKNFDHFTDHKPFVDETIDPLLGSNLFSIKGDRWKEMRSIISPVFTSSKMKAMFELVRKCADDFTLYLKKQPPPLTLEMKDVFTRYANDVIATSAFGVSVNSLEEKDNEFFTMGADATNFTGLRGFRMFLFSLCPKVMKLLRQTLISTKVRNFFQHVVRDTISTRKRDGITRPDLIHQLMQARHKESDAELTIEDITAQAFLFFFAGFDTVSTLMCFACHQLAVHQDMQDRLVAEIDAAFEEEKDDKLSYDTVNHLQYLEMFLNETLRFYPPAVFTDRVNTREFELPPADEAAKPILAKPGTRLWISIYGLHHDPKHFPDPEKFDPERFSAENKGGINQFAYLPFGVGPRICPGNRFALMETKLVLCSILRNFRILVSAKTHLPLVLSKSTPAMTAEHGFWLDLEPRNVAVI